MTASAFSRATPAPTPTVLRDVLTGRDRQNLIRYVNGECSELAGTLSGGMGGGMDTEDAMIEGLDRIKAFREVHKAMLALGTHARTLTGAFLVQPVPPAIRKHFGELAGIAVWRAPSVDALLDDCTALDRGEAAARKEAKRRTTALRLDAHLLLAAAERAYVGALAVARAEGRVRPTAAMVWVQAEHRCRAPGVYGCPCQAEGGRGR